MSRISKLSMDEMSEEQINISKDITKSRGKGISNQNHAPNGPFNAWLRNPQLADRGQKLGELLRFQTSWEPRLSELAICMVARHTGAKFEWYAHAALAKKAGLEDSIIDAIAYKKDPEFIQENEKQVYEIVTSLLETHHLSDELYATAIDNFGEKAIVELVALVGYYLMVSLTLNCFQELPPEGSKPSLPDL